MPIVEAPIVLLLSVASQGKYSPELTSQLESQLQRAGWKLASASGLDEGARAAREGQELLKLAQQTGSRFVLFAEIAALEGPERRIYLRAFDARNGRSTPKTHVCSFSQLEAETAKTASALLHRMSHPEEPRQAELKSFQPLLPPPKPIDRPRLPKWRRGLAAALGILAAGSLAMAIGLTLTDDKRPGSGGDGCTYLRNSVEHLGITTCTRLNMPAYTTGYVLAGLFLAGMTATVSF